MEEEGLRKKDGCSLKEERRGMQTERRWMDVDRGRTRDADRGKTRNADRGMQMRDADRGLQMKDADRGRTRDADRAMQMRGKRMDAGRGRTREDEGLRWRDADKRVADKRDADCEKKTKKGHALHGLCPPYPAPPAVWSVRCRTKKTKSLTLVFPFFFCSFRPRLPALHTTA